ncbi:hypothetical protein C484_00405 [Natrialba taiwanensis DSM 12281]|uniref:Uncharacterized protein n=2 Tax=Natrialba taiwanensis TaxID=160846 RepID=M0AE79_9EURY|nr:hypothetical protein C484_00405 [Natrialba taiwanensis DSM 12281]
MDYQLFRAERPTKLVAKYAFETADPELDWLTRHVFVAGTRQPTGVRLVVSRVG